MNFVILLEILYTCIIEFKTKMRYFVFLPCQGDSNNAVLVNESIDFLKSSLEKTESGLVKIRDINAAENGRETVPRTADSSLPLATSATNIKDKAAIHMLLACKRNVILFHFYRTGMFSLAAHKQRSPEKHLGELRFL